MSTTENTTTSPKPEPSSGTQATTPQLRPIPSHIAQQLKAIDGGKIFQRLQHVRDHCIFIAPTEMYLLLNPANIKSTAAAYFAKGARFIERCRNIFVLIPLLLTWLALCIASAAYTQSITANPK